VRSQQKTSVLANTAAILSRQLRAELDRFSRRLAPQAARLERSFRKLLGQRGYAAAQVASLCEITPAAVARSLAAGTTLAAFLEQVEYRGRRLAKLGLGPGAVLEAMTEFDRLLEDDRSAAGQDGSNVDWALAQLRFLVVLGLNNAFYQVREAESQAFYGMFRAEVEAVSLADLVDRFLGVLKQYTGAEQARLWLFETPPKASRRLAAPFCRRLAQAAPQLVLEPAWRKGFATVWSVPLKSPEGLAGAMQFAFKKEYDWLPREQELLAAAAERCRRAVEKTRLLEDLARREEQIRRLAEHMVEVEEAERRRISRELHDEAGQSLLCVRLQLEMIEQDLPESQQEVRKRLAEARDLTEHSIVEIRRLIAALSPAILEQIGLAPALRQLVQRFRRIHPAQFQVRIPRRLELPKKMEIVVYRLVQECLNNISKYSGAAQVNLFVESADGILRVRIEDDGVGFDVTAALERRDCYGLSGLRERVALLGGSVEVKSRPRPLGGEGTVRQTQRARKAKPGRKASGTAVAIELPVPTAKPGGKAPLAG
jgi:signal transduction histidine kinase